MTTLEFSGVTKTYGAVKALDGVSFAVRRGEMFGVIGPDGAGKTTAIRIACGLLRVDGGAVTVLGHDPVKDHRAVTAGIGYLSQRFSLYGDLTIDENIDKRTLAVGGRASGRLERKLSERLSVGLAAAFEVYGAPLADGTWFNRRLGGTQLLTVGLSASCWLD